MIAVHLRRCAVLIRACILGSGIRSATQDLVMADREIMLQEVARAISRPLANMKGGCFKPKHKSDRADCADGDCYCMRVSRHCAEAAIETIQRLTSLTTTGAGNGR